MNNGDALQGLNDYDRWKIQERFLKGVTKVVRPNNMDKADKEKSSQTTKLLELAADVELFHDNNPEAYASFRVNDHTENWPMKSRTFKRWLQYQYFLETKKGVGAQAIQDALGVLEAKAIFEGPEEQIAVRVGEHQGNIFIDLISPAWECVEIGISGWRIIGNPPIKFVRAKGMLSLPEPVANGKVHDLKKFMNITSERDRQLVLSWLLQAYNPKGPYPVLAIHGGQGACKSTLARVLKSLVDPNVSELRSRMKDERDLVISAKNSWMLCFDNLSSLSHELSDAFCRLSTGGGFSTRQLFTDSEETLFQSQRPVIFNGISEIATRGDLLNRALLVYLPEVPEDKRIPDRKFWDQFDAVRPALLGALFNAVAHILKTIETVSLKAMPRMADFAIWSTAAEEPLGFSSGSFLNAYRTNTESTHELALETSLIVPPLRVFMAGREEWQGTATSLLSELKTEVDEDVRRQRAWPKNARSLSSHLRRLQPNLYATGFQVEFNPGYTRLITITKHTVEPGKEPIQADNFASVASVASKELATDGKITDAKSTHRHDGSEALNQDFPAWANGDAPLPDIDANEEPESFHKNSHIDAKTQPLFMVNLDED